MTTAGECGLPTHGVTPGGLPGGCLATPRSLRGPRLRRIRSVSLVAGFPVVAHILCGGAERAPLRKVPIRPAEVRTWPDCTPCGSFSPEVASLFARTPVFNERGWDRPSTTRPGGMDLGA